jgi:hypothetical protein
MNGLTRALRSFVNGGDRELARSWQVQAVTTRDAAARRDLEAFLETLRTEPGSGRFLLGRVRDLEDRPEWVGLPLNEILGQHAWITGATGSGKTFFVLAGLLQVLRAKEHPVIVVDLKGELSTLLREVLLPALVSRTDGAEAFLQHLRVIRPFDRDTLPMLRITRSEPGVSREIQAHAIASSLEDALGEDLGGRMIRTFLKLTSLAIELDRPLTDVLRWLEEPRALALDARRSQNSGIRRYAAAFAQENRASIEALLARLDTFLFLRETQLCLGAPECISFHDCLDRGVTILDLGDPPAGAERAARFWGGVLVGRLTRAILSREVTQRSPQAWVVFEEFQEALGRSQTEQFGRLLALARYKRVGLCFVNQQVGQIAAREPALVKLLRTNTGLEAAFRCNFEDAKGLSHALPVPRDARSPAGARQRLTEEMTRLPDRTFYLWLKKKPFRAQRVRSPRLDLAGLRKAAEEASGEVRERIHRGTVAMPRGELEAAMAEPVPEEKEPWGDVEPSPPREEETDVPFLG